MADDTAPAPELKLFHATLAVEVVVLATSAEAAMQIAEDEARKHSADVGGIVEMDCIPEGWDEECIPLGHCDPAAPDRTLGQWIEAGAAPKYLELLRRLAEASSRGS